MTKAAINKSSLAHQRSQLRLFQRFLPSLDLKRQQLLTEQKEAQRQLADSEREIARLTRSLTGLMEPLGAYEIDLHGLVTVDSVVIEEENIVGARLPVAREVKFKTAPYAMLGKPFWVDFLVEYLQQMCILRVHLQVRHERVTRLNHQVRKITQRVNLFEKVLIPQAKENIKRIQIGLAEQERSAVVRSKIAKKKRAVISSPDAALGLRKTIMAIVPLDKLTLYGAETQQEPVLEQLQVLGFAHLIDLTESGSDYASNDVSTDVRDALRYLSVCPEQLRPIRRIDQFHREAVVSDALGLKNQQHRLNDERDELQKAIKDVKPWGEFQLSADGRIGDVRLWFYIALLHDLPKFAAGAVPWREVNRDHRNAYVVALSRDEPQDVPGARVDLDPRPLSELSARLEDVDESLAETQYQRVGLTRWCDLLSAGLGEADDAAERDQAARKLLHGDKVFALQGWVPRNATDRIRKFAADHNLAVTIEPPGPNDEPPTLLHNPERLAGSEALMTFYKTPDYRAWDPSIVSFVSFAIFFAMIVADAGYGVIFALLAAFFWRKPGTTAGGRRSRNIIAAIVACTIVYGIMCGSYFGVSPPADSLPGHLKVIDAQSQSQMMPLTIVIGVIHLSLAHLVTAWLHRGRAMALASLGWVSVMAGATLLGIGVLGSDVTEHRAQQLSQAGTILLVGGLIAVFLFSSQRPMFSFSIRTHVLRVFDGLQALTGLSGLFGDALSYLRLFALGLASAKLSETFNGLGASAWDNAGFGVIMGIGIVILGHTLNLLLSIMGGVVHGLRLNCIEFYKWSLPEEGYSFKAFAKKVKSS